MTGVEQVIERVDQATALPSVPPSPSERPRAGDPPAHDSVRPHASFSPDPARRTDRYRLVTPYCLRL